MQHRGPGAHAAGPASPGTWGIQGDHAQPAILILACDSSSPAFHMMYSAYKLNTQGDNGQPVCCSMSSSNCCFLTCIQVSQEVGQVVWYSHLFQNFSQFIVIHTVKGFGIVNKAEIDVFLELLFFR